MTNKVKSCYHISIIVVNYNGINFLGDFFSSLEEQTYRNFEVIFVDNNSTDSSISFVSTNYPWVKIIKSRENSGFAGGNNLGYKYSSGGIVVLLNNDIVLPRTYLNDFIKAFEDEEVSIAQSKIILLNEKNKLDSCGSLWTSTTLLYHIGCGRNPDNANFNKKMLLFSVKGASMAVRRSVIEDIGLFDEKAWCYYEESDFCHRAWVAGYKSWYYPDAYCYHANGGTSKAFNSSSIQFHNFKNRLSSYVKNFELLTLLTVAPSFIIFCLSICAIWLIQGKLSLISSVFSAIGWNVKNLRPNLAERKKIQSARKLSDRKIFSLVSKRPRLSYYYHALIGSQIYED